MEKNRISFFQLLGNKVFFWLYFVAGMIFSVLSVAASALSGSLVDAVVYGDGGASQAGKIGAYLGRLVLVYALLLIFSAADQYFHRIFLVREKRRMRQRGFAAFLRRKETGRGEISEFESFVNNDLPCVAEQYFAGTVDICKCLCLAACIAAELLRVHWLLAVIIAVSCVLIAALPGWFSTYASGQRKEYGTALGRYNTLMESLLGGADVIRAYLYEKRACLRLDEENACAAEREQKLCNCQTLIYGLAGSLQILKKFLILAVGVLLVQRQAITVGGLLVAVQLAELLAAPAEMLAYLRNARNEARPLVEKYADLLSRSTAETGTKAFPENADICVENLSYAVNGVTILKHWSGFFQNGGKYLLVGKSGSGKSTLLRLLGNLAGTPHEGTICVAGLKLPEMDGASFYRKVGIVLQEPYLFWAPLRENIVMGREIREEDYEAVIRRLNLGYLLERYAGRELDAQAVSLLSGGEKQRIAIARAMVGKPAVYLLDEVTSSLDEKNALEVERLLLAEPATVIYACHKMLPQLAGEYEVVEV